MDVRSLACSALSVFTVFAGPASAQRRIGGDCFTNGQGVLAEYGRAVALTGDLDRKGRSELLVGAPAAIRPSGCYCDPVGAVFLPGALPVFGQDVDDRFGTSVAGALDLDGDLQSDAVAGAPGDDDHGAECGSVTALAADGTELYTLFGDAPGDRLGSSVGRIGDLDGDGRDDFVVGAPQTGNGGAGYARVVSGGNGATIRTHAGPSSGARCGVAVTGLGDVTGDGVPDYAVGSPGSAGSGRVHVYSGRDGRLVRAHGGPHDFGHGLGAGTDVDRDGVQELVVGAPAGDTGVGTVWVFSGRTGAELLQLGGSEAGDWFGASVAGCGDFDGDGHGDLVVGAPYADPFLPVGYGNGPGAASVFSGRNGELLARIGGGAFNARTGVSVAGGGDLDGDGLGDALVGGLMNNDGYGDLACVVAIGRTGDQRIDRGSSGSMAFGHSVAGIADFDGDGTPDVLVGAPGAANPQELRTGLARVVSGATGETLVELFGEADGDRLGQAVANAGDVNADGVDDLLVGSAQDRASSSGIVRDGYAKIYSGATGTVLHRFEIPGERAFGRALAGGKDLDGDGFDDVIVGGAEVDLARGGFRSAGHVRVYSGQTGQELYAFDGATSSEGLGFSVALIEDLNGDGMGEFLFGVPGRLVQQPQLHFGEVELRSGADGVLLHAFWTLDLGAGTALTRLDDVNGDGIEDIAFSGWDPQQLWSVGWVYVHSGADQGLLWSAADQVPYTGPSFGYALSSAGDVDGDMLDDLAIGNPGTNDWHATSIGAVQVRSGATGQSLSSLSGYAGWDYFGYSVAGIGDVNGDGRPDLVVGAPTEPDNPSGAEPGWNRVHFALSNYLRQHSHCTPSVNGSGEYATLRAAGLSSVVQNELTLEVDGAAPLANGYVFMGTGVQSTPLYGGTLCVQGSIRRLAPALQTSGQGAASLSVDLASGAASAIQGGSTWSFQFLFRDPNGPSGSRLNLSDAVRIDFLP